MTWAKPETIQQLFSVACAMPVVDAHTHIQDDLTGFSQQQAEQNLAGTQSAVNAYPDYIIRAGLAQGRLARRTMMDVAHGCFYSWFAEAVEGRRARLDAIIHTLGQNTEAERRQAAALLIGELQDARYSEYAEWLRFMFRLYDGARELDPLDPANVDRVWDAVQQQRNDPAFAARILRENNILGYVTSLENRDRVPLDPRDARVGQLDLAYATHPESYAMFDAHYLLWPEGATDFGLFLGGQKYEGEKFLLHLERVLGVPIRDARSLREGIKAFLFRILYSPTHNPTSRVRYTNIFQPLTLRLARPVDTAAVNTIIRYRKAFTHGNDLQQLTALTAQATLEALDEIGADLKRSGSEHGSCLQIAIGVSYFMDMSREIQSFPLYAAGIPQDEYAVWSEYPNVHFEYIVAHEGLYTDFSGAAKQVGNLSVGPWWHFFRKHRIAAMLVDQLSMGSVSSIASGFTDARFVEMLAAKYRSVRWAVATALAELVDDPASSMTVDGARQVMRAILLENPARVHHLPLQLPAAE